MMEPSVKILVIYIETIVLHSWHVQASFVIQSDGALRDLTENGWRSILLLSAWQNLLAGGTRVTSGWIAIEGDFSVTY